MTLIIVHAAHMNTQNQINRTLSQPIVIAQIVTLLEEGQAEARSALAERLCRDFALRNPRGELQLSGCLEALRQLEAEGHFTLPSPRLDSGNNSPRGLSSPVPPPNCVPSDVGLVKELSLILVKTEEHRWLWNQMMLDEHPRGAGPFVGPPLRYLVGSAHGWLGGFGFGAAALQLADRDQWIGWDVEQRRAWLHVVVGLSRFLLHPSVVCRNLGSHLLALYYYPRKSLRRTTTRHSTKFISV